MAKYSVEDDVASKKADAVKQVKIKSMKDKGMSDRDATIAGLMEEAPQQPEPPPMASSNGSESGEGPVAAPDLRLNLSFDDLRRMGLTEHPKIGDVCSFDIKATPEHISKEGVEFQVVDMTWESNEGEATDVKPGADESKETDKSEDEGDY